MESVQAAGTDDFIYVPTLVSLLRNRRLKGRARAALVSYGEPVVDSLAFFLRDAEEDIWVRRHIPGTLAQIPSQKTMDVLASVLDERDGFIRYKVVSALERLRREHPELTLEGEPVERLVVQEARRFFNSLSLHDNLFGKGKLNPDSLLSQGLLEQMTRLRNRIFKLLTLLYPPVDIDAARWTLEHGDARARSSASEYLDNILSSPLRKQVLPVLEDMPREERVRRGNTLLKTRPRDVEETLLQLINDDDPVTAAAAIDLVREQKMWSLADDVEHVLAHRDVKDWYVFEAASWTLAEQRMPAERRRELWLEPLPAAELAGRLRRLPLFASVTVDELFRMASASRQVRHESGSVLGQEGSVPTSIHILLDGRVTAAARDAAPSIVDAPAALAFVEAMAGLPMPETTRTTGSAVTLALTVDELRTLLADNTDLVSGLFATLAAQSDEADLPVRPTNAARELEQLTSGGLTAIDRVFALQYVPLFRRVSADEMQHLASVAGPVNMAAGSVLFPESAPPALWLLLSGEVAARKLDREAPRHGPWGRHHRVGEHDGRAEPGPVGQGRQGRHRAQSRPRRPVRRPGRTAGPAASDVRRHVQARPAVDGDALKAGIPGYFAVACALRSISCWPRRMLHHCLCSAIGIPHSTQTRTRCFGWFFENSFEKNDILTTAVSYRTPTRRPSRV